MVVNSIVLLVIAGVMYNDGSFSKAWLRVKSTMKTASPVSTEVTSEAQPTPLNPPHALDPLGVGSSVHTNRASVPLAPTENPRLDTSRLAATRGNGVAQLPGLSLWYGHHRIHAGEKITLVAGRQLIVEVTHGGPPDHVLEIELVRELTPVFPRRRVMATNNQRLLSRAEMQLAEPGLYAVRLFRNGTPLKTITFEMTGI
jgi:hypothetical protein